MRELIVSTADGVRSLCSSLQGSEYIAVDTEFMRERTYVPDFCLLQLCNGAVAAVVDVLHLPNEALHPVWEVLKSRAVTKEMMFISYNLVLHSAKQDLEILHRVCGCKIGPLFDTQHAAEFLAYGQKGFGDLVDRVLGVKLEKCQTRTNWAQRPLTQEQLRYALDDVVYLAPLYEKMRIQLEAANRLAWMELDMRELEEYEAMRHPSTAFHHVKGARGLHGKQLSVLQSVSAWRESTAQRRNLPRQWVAKDELLVHAARTQPRSLQDLRGVRCVTPRQACGMHGFIDAVRKGSEVPAQKWPELPPSNTPSLSTHQEAIADLLAACLKLCAKEHKLSSSVVCTRNDLARLIKGHRDMPVASGWRFEVAGRVLVEVLKGEKTAVIEDGKMCIRSTTVIKPSQSGTSASASE